MNTDLAQRHTAADMIRTTWGDLGAAVRLLIVARAASFKAWLAARVSQDPPTVHDKAWAFIGDANVAHATTFHIGTMDTCPDPRCRMAAQLERDGWAIDGADLPAEVLK